MSWYAQVTFWEIKVNLELLEQFFLGGNKSKTAYFDPKISFEQLRYEFKGFESNLSLLTEKNLFSDVEVDEEEDESQPHTVKKLEGLHKRTGAPLTEIEINTDEVKIPPADFVAKVTLTAEGDNDENAMEE